MTASVLRCGKLFDGLADRLTGPAEILVDGDRIVEIGASVRRPPDAQTIDLSQRTVSPGFIDTHVHLTMDAAVLAQQTLASSAAKALEVVCALRSAPCGWPHASCISRVRSTNHWTSIRRGA